MAITRTSFVVAVLVASIVGLAEAQTPSDQTVPDYTKVRRIGVPEQDRWDLTQIFPSLEAWEEEKARFEALIENIDSVFIGWTSSPERMLRFLEYDSELEAIFYRLIRYASLSRDVDLENPAFQTMEGEALYLLFRGNAKTASRDQDLLGLGKDTFEAYLHEEPRLAPYAFQIRRLFANTDHRLPEGEQRVYANFRSLGPLPRRTALTLRDDEIPKPVITLADGKEYTVDFATFTRLSTGANRGDRVRIREAYYNSLRDFEGTFALLLDAQKKYYVAEARSRKYGDAMEAAMNRQDLSPSVYTSNIEAVRGNLAPLHRYLTLKKEILGLDELTIYERFAPLVNESDAEYSFAEAQRIVLEASALLGREYQAVLAQAFSERWIDRYPHLGKKSLGYSSYVDGSHPYVLLNYTGTFRDIEVMIHELGHSVHSYLSNKVQHRENATPPALLGEVAALFNEQMLLDYMLRVSEDDVFKLFLLDRSLRGIIAGIYNQTKRAELERAMYDRVERGQPLTAEWLREKTLEIERDYFGHEKGICQIDEVYGGDWIDTPHYYQDYYLINYTVGRAASMALFSMVRSGGAAERDRYIDFLRAGGSAPSTQILSAAGVDLESETLYRAAFDEFDRLLNEMRVLISRLQAEGRLGELRQGES